MQYCCRYPGTRHGLFVFVVVYLCAWLLPGLRTLWYSQLLLRFVVFRCKQQNKMSKPFWGTDLKKSFLTFLEPKSFWEKVQCVCLWLIELTKHTVAILTFRFKISYSNQSCLVIGEPLTWVPSHNQGFLHDVCICVCVCVFDGGESSF